MNNYTAKLLPAIITALIFCCHPIFADESYTKRDVTDLIGKTEKKVAHIQNSSNARLVAKEIARIKEYINRSRQLLSSNKVEEAFYEASIGVIYFLLIDAKIDLDKANRELEESKRKTKR